MHHNHAASYTWVFPGDTLTAGYQGESIRRLADALGMTIVREYEDEGRGQGPGGRPQFQWMMDEARAEGRPFGAIIACDRSRLDAARQGAPGRRSRAALRVGQAAKRHPKGTEPGGPATEPIGDH